MEKMKSEEEDEDPVSRSEAVRRVLEIPEFAALAMGEKRYSEEVIEEVERRFGPFDEEIPPRLVWRQKSNIIDKVVEAARQHKKSQFQSDDLRSREESPEMGRLTDEEIDAIFDHLTGRDREQ